MGLLITEQELQEYSKTFDAGSTILPIVIGAAEDIVLDYLGYDPNHQSRVAYISGHGSNRIQLQAKRITDITSIAINSVEIDHTDIVPVDPFSEWIFNTKQDPIFTKGFHNILVAYDAGFDDIPPAIKLCTLRIAALLLTETTSIGITSVSSAFDGGSRTFYNFSNFGKYLQSIEAYRICRLN